MNYKEVRKRLLAAEELLHETSTSRRKVESLRKLLKGIDPRLDKALKPLTRAWFKAEQLYTVKIIELGADKLPEKNEKTKEKKKSHSPPSP